MEHGHRFLPDGQLQFLPFPVFAAQFRGQRRRPAAIPGFQQPDGHFRNTQPSRRVDPGRQRVSNGGGGQLFLRRSRLFQQRPEPGAAFSLGDHLQPIAGDEPVLAQNGHHVRHRADGHQIPVFPEHLLSVSVHGADQLEGHAHARQRLARRAVVRPLGIHHRFRLREGLPAFMVIGDDHIHAPAVGIVRLFQIGDAAVHRDDERHAPIRQGVDGGGIQPVSFRDPIRDIQFAPEPSPAEVVRQQAPGRDPIHIIIPIDRHMLPRGDGAGEPLDRRDHVRQPERVLQQFGAPGQKAVDLSGVRHPAEMEDGRQQGRAPRRQKRRRDHRASGRDFPIRIFHSFPPQYCF